MQGLLDHYVRLRDASHRMLAAARVNRWADVRGIEDECRREIERLRAASRGRTLSADDTRRKMALMLEIVRVDAEVRRLAQPWIGSLDRLLDPRPSPRA